MNSLHIDLNYNSTILILFDNKTKDNEFYFKSNNNDVIDNCIDSINNFLTKNNISIKEIKNIYFNIGPGTYTGNKATINIVKTIFNIYKDKQFYYLNGLQIFSNLNGAAIIDAKGNKSFVAVYKNNDFNPILGPLIINNNEVNELLDNYEIEQHNEKKIKEFYLEHFLNLIEHFRKVSNPLEIQPLYLKEAI